ncbi:MAG: methyltransferase domain-containing protein [Actinomycetota bacterium]|nr:methyltransferase domain-containing protein [Actinomycetota bacterium]
MSVHWRVDETSTRAQGLTLHLGCVDDPERIGVDEWLHPRLVTTAGEVVGLDISQAGLKEMQDRGVDGAGLVTGDAMNLPFRKDTFDTVVAGEIIEHVGRPQDLVAEGGRVLKPGGRLIITTPNPFCLPWIIKSRRGPQATWNPEHVGWFDGATLARLADRAAGLKLEEFVWVENRDPHLDMAPGRYRTYVRLKPLLRRLVPRRLISEGFLATFTK